jgi:signal transduction histidine kinase
MRILAYLNMVKFTVMSFYAFSLIATGIASIMLGIFVYLQGRDKPANITLVLYTIAVAVWCLGQAAGEMIPDKTGVIFWTRFNLGGAILIPVLYMTFVLAFLNGLEQNKRLISACFLFCSILLFFDITPLFVADVAPRLNFRFYPIPGPAYYLFPFYFLGCISIGFFKLIAAARESFGVRRNQILYIILASIIGFGGGATAFFPVFNINFPPLAHYFVPLYILIVVYAIARHQLLDIRIILRGGLTYSILTLFFTGVYALLVFSFKEIFQSLTGWNTFLTTVIMVFGAVMIFEPLHKRVQDVVDRLFFRGSYYYQKTISDLSDENLKLYRGLLQSEKLAALGTMAACLAHEIKNPLASIKGMTQILPENLGDQEFIDKYADIVPRQLNRINSIIDTLLKIGKPQKFAVSNVNLNKIIDDLLKLVEGQCRKKNIKVASMVSEDLNLEGDAEQLMQAFMNLVLNAIDAMSEGGELKVSGLKHKAGMTIEISDTGVGIPQENIKRVFDPFFTTKESGAGLGLAITYRIIKEHSGEIEVESEEGKGSKFKIWLYTKQKE